MAADAPIGKWRSRGSNRDDSNQCRGLLVRPTKSWSLYSDAPHSAGSRHVVAQQSPATRLERMFRPAQTAAEIVRSTAAWFSQALEPQVGSRIKENAGKKQALGFYTKHNEVGAGLNLEHVALSSSSAPEPRPTCARCRLRSRKWIAGSGSRPPRYFCPPPAHSHEQEAPVAEELRGLAFKSVTHELKNPSHYEQQQRVPPQSMQEESSCEKG